MSALIKLFLLVLSFTQLFIVISVRFELHLFIEGGLW